MNLTWKIALPGTDEKSFPNISLNTRYDAKAKLLFSAALFGTVLQSGMLVFCGLSVYHQEFSRRFPKDGRPVETYAFLIMAVGTVLLMVGMFICSAVVEKSTDEKEYRPISAPIVGLLWLQKSNAVLDQSFDSFVFGRHDRQYDRILTSRRSVGFEERDSVQNFTQLGVLCGLCGFVLQFQVSFEVLDHEEIA